MLQTRVKFLLIVLGFFHLSYGNIFNVNYSYTYPVNKTLYSSVFLQQNQKSFRLLAGAPKNDRISICNATECQSFSYKVPNEAGFEMLGATISAGNTVGDATYICAPRYIVVLPNFRVNGRCFALHENFTAIHSLNNPYQQVKLYNGSYEFYHAHGQVGFSAKYIDNSEFLLGAPGVLSWKGTVIKHTDFNTKDILNAEKIVDRNSYLGYAIEFGEFNFGGRKRRCAIGGAPRGDTLLGQILKPQKSRKPLCDLDLGNEDSDDTANMNKTSRRVSFASNNFIKPFVADPEKNTIWDLTYEEAIEHSGSSQSIKIVPDNKENECSPLNVTMFYSEDVCELDITSAVGRIETHNKIEAQATLATNYNVEDMELTTDIDFNAQCIIVNDRNEDRCCDMEFTVPINNFGIISARNENNPEMDLGDMEFTVPINNFGIISSENKNNAEISLADMEFTTPISGAILNVNRTNIENVDMSFDLTCDDTEKLINYDLSGAKTSDFSKVIAGDLDPSFPNLPAMPLRGINSTSFVQSLPSEIRSCGGSRDVSNMSMPSVQDKENCVNQSMDIEMDITCDNNEIQVNCEETEINKQVFIFDYNDIQEIPLKILKGQQMGAYYGSSLLVAMQYLFVGAPMHNTKAYEEGCVFIYRNDKDDLLLWQTICGQDKGGRFGTAMTSFGRIDNYVQPIGVVISAPYSDDGAGIIYIYEENDAGFKELQQIYGKTISSDIIGFGMSLSNGIDIDDNGYNDFAVGSLASNQLVILRSRKVLKFYGYFQSFVDKISTTTKDIIVTYCYFYAGRLGELAYVNTSITMESDARVIIAMPSRNATIRIGKNTCVNFTLTIKPHAFDSPLPLKLKITNKLEECPECPIAHPKPHSSTLTIPFITGCGTDNICVTDLKLQAQFDDATELIIGTRDDLPFTVLVSNLGETAYSTKMYLTVSTEIRQFPPACSKTLNTLQCDISNRFIANQTKKLEFQLDVKRLDPRMQEIRIDINVSSSSSGNSTNLTITLPVALRSNLTFIGFANPEYVESRDSVNFTHEYVVFNSGPSPLLDERFRFEIPENVVNNHGGNITPFIITPLADECIPDSELPSRTPRDTSNLEQTLSGFPSEIKHNIGCRQNRLMNCKTYTCMIGELIANTSMKFRFKVEVKSSLLFDALGEEVETKSLFIVESLGATTDGNNKDKDQEVLVRTVLFRKTVESMQSLWIWIVVAVISSIIILLIIIVILYKLQFFARPMREKLLNEEEHHHERECMIVNDDSHCDSSNSQDESPNSLCEESTSEPFKDIKF